MVIVGYPNQGSAEFIFEVIIHKNRKGIIMADSKLNPRGASRPQDGRGGGKGMPGGQRGGQNTGGCKPGGPGGGRGGGKGGGRGRER